MPDSTERPNPTIPRITLPPDDPPTPEEIARRRKLYDEVMKLRDEIGPIGIRADELIRMGREEAEYEDLIDLDRT